MVRVSVSPVKLEDNNMITHHHFFPTLVFEVVTVATCCTIILNLQVVSLQTRTSRLPRMMAAARLQKRQICMPATFPTTKPQHGHFTTSFHPIIIGRCASSRVGGRRGWIDNVMDAPHPLFCLWRGRERKTSVLSRPPSPYFSDRKDRLHVHGSQYVYWRRHLLLLRVRQHPLRHPHRPRRDHRRPPDLRRGAPVRLESQDGRLPRRHLRLGAARRFLATRCTKKDHRARAELTIERAPARRPVCQGRRLLLLRPGRARRGLAPAVLPPERRAPAERQGAAHDGR